MLKLVFVILFLSMSCYAQEKECECKEETVSKKEIEEARNNGAIEGAVWSYILFAD